MEPKQVLYISSKLVKEIENHHSDKRLADTIVEVSKNPYYALLLKHYPYIFKGIVQKLITSNNLYLLTQMLHEDIKVRTGDSSSDNAKQIISESLSNNHGVDWSKLNQK